MGIGIIDNFSLSHTKFLDNRQSYPTLEALNADNTTKMPKGMEVYIEDESKWYVMSCTDVNDPTTYVWTERPTGGSGGTTDYEDLTNKPTINNVELNGDLTEEDLSLAGTHVGHTINLFNKDDPDIYLGVMNTGSVNGSPNPVFTPVPSSSSYRMTHFIELDSTKTYRMIFYNAPNMGGWTTPETFSVGLAYWDEANNRYVAYKSTNYTAFSMIDGYTATQYTYCDITVPVTGKYRLNYQISASYPAADLMITEIGEWPEGYPNPQRTGYVPFDQWRELDTDIVIPDLESLQEEVDAMDVDNKVDYHTYSSPNLFNPANIETGKRLNYNSSPTSNVGSCITGKIPVKPNTWYHWHKGANRGGERTLVLYKANNGVTYAEAAYYDNGNEMGKVQSTGKYLISGSGKFLTPADVSYVRFNISWYGTTENPSTNATFQEGDQNDYELEEGEVWTGPNPWIEPYKAIAPEDLKPEYRDLPERMDSAEDAIDSIIESSGGMTIIDPYSSDKIGFFSNSFLNGYAMQGQHTIQRVMQFCDYVGYNYSISGYDMVELAAKMNRDETFLGACKPSEIGPLKYGIIMHQDNDGIVYSMNHRSYYENAKHLGYSIRSLGGEPVISTEHDWNVNYQIFQRLCQDEGWEFLDWGKEAVAEDPSPRYQPFWHSGHPATRTGWLQVYGFLPFVMSRPRPQKSMKLFRLRSATDSSDINNLLYNTILERWDRWQEIRTGQSGLTSAADKYFDRWGTTGYATQNWYCEYQKLIKHESVNFGNYLLADVTTPYNSHSVTYGKFEITGTGVEHVYARKIRYMDPCWLPSSAANYLSFGVTAGIENLPVGTQFTVSGITREDGTNINGVTFTVGSVLDGMIVTTTPLGSTYTTSGTDTPVCSVPGVTMAGTYSYPNPAYAAKWNTPLGQWEELTMTATSNGWEVELTDAQLEKYCDEDKYVFMASGTDITITDIRFTCAGTNEKLLLENKRVIPKVQKGANLLTSTYMKTADEANWTNLSNIATVTPITDGTYTETYPDSLTPRNFMAGDWVCQQIKASGLTQTKWKKPTRIQIQVLARYFPPYALTDEDYATCGVTEDCTFTGKLEVQLSNGSTLPADKSQNPITTFYVGGWWHVHTFDYDVINSTYNYLFLKALDDNIQIGAVWVVSADPADGKQDTLISGTNIKTINGNDILGSGDITIQGIEGNYVEYDEIIGANLFNKDSSDNLLGYFCNTGSNAGTTISSLNTGSGYALTHLIHFNAGDVVRTFFGASSSYGGYDSSNPTAYRIAYIRLKDDGSGKYVGYKGTDTATVTLIDGVAPTSAMYADITIPVTGDYRFNYIRTTSALMGPNYFMVTKLSEWPEGYPADTTKYVPYVDPKKVVKDEYIYPPIEDMQDQLDGFQAQLDAIDVDNKIDYHTYTSINLFNPAEIILDKRFDYNASTVTNVGSCVSGLIPIKPDTYYHFKKGTQRGSERTAKILAANGTTVLEAAEAYKDDGTVMAKNTYQNKWVLGMYDSSFYFKTPSNAAYFQFNIAWSPVYQAGDELSGYQLEEGTSYSGPHDWFDPYKALAPEDLKPEYRNLPDRVEALENLSGSAVIKINAYSSDKVGFFSNSYLDGYTMVGQHAIDKVMSFSDYVPFNYSVSGWDMAEQAYGLNQDSSVRSDCKPSEVGPIKYGIIMHQDNDGILYGMNHRAYYENAKHLGYSIMSLGGEPILSTEHDYAVNYQVLQRLCQDEGWRFLPWGKEATLVNGNYTPFWYSGHPATRTSWVQTYGFLPAIESLPRPQKSMKLFRLRSSVDSSDINNLLYNTMQERWDRWQGLHTGETALNEANAKYVDRANDGSYTTFKDEYAKLIKNIAVSFGSHLLADVTTPYNVRSITYAKFGITGTGIEHVYARKIRYMNPTWLPSQAAKYLAFGVTAGIENLPVGTQFTVSGITREDGQNINGVTFTVGSVTDGYIVTTTPTGSTYVTSGTDVPVCSVTGVTMAGTYDYPNPEYVANWDHPLGQWEELTMTTVTGGWEVELTPAQIEKFGAGDKYVFMATGTDITITDIYLDVSGTNNKLLLENKRIISPAKKGNSMLTSTWLKTADEANWTNLSNITVQTPITDGTRTETYPSSLTCRNFMAGDWISQAINNLTAVDYKEPTRIQIQVLARYFPPYALTDEDYAASGMSVDSTFTGKLEVQVYSSATPPADKYQNPITTFYVGAWWHVHTFDYDVINTSYNYLILKALDDNIQIGAVWVVPLN